MKNLRIFLIPALALATFFPAGANPDRIEQAFAALYNPTSQYFTLNFHETILDLPEEDQASVIARLKKALDSELPETRRDAALTLHRIGQPEGAQVMNRDVVELTNTHLRGNAAVALRVIQDPSSIHALIKASRDPDPYIRSIAISALGEMKATNAVQAILDRLEDSERLDGCMIQTPGQDACYALGALGDTNNIIYLQTLIDNIESNQSEGPLDNPLNSYIDAHLAMWKLQGISTNERRALYYSLIGQKPPNKEGQLTP